MCARAPQSSSTREVDIRQLSPLWLVYLDTICPEQQAWPREATGCLVTLVEIIKGMWWAAEVGGGSCRNLMKIHVWRWCFCSTTVTYWVGWGVSELLNAISGSWWLIAAWHVITWTKRNKVSPCCRSDRSGGRHDTHLKRKWSQAERPALSESLEDIVGGLLNGGCEQLQDDPVSLALLRIGQQEAQAWWCAGGWILPPPHPPGGSVESNTDIAACCVSECGGHHHGSALGWGRRASRLSPLLVPALCCVVGCGGWTEAARSPCRLGPAWLLLLLGHLMSAEGSKDRIRKTFIILLFWKRGNSKLATSWSETDNLIIDHLNNSEDCWVFSFPEFILTFDVTEGRARVALQATRPTRS